MTAILCPSIPQRFMDAASVKKFFSDAEVKNVNAFSIRELPLSGAAGPSCRTNLFFGFFFDGTKNNYVQAEKGRNHSNVARLYDCYPGQSVPGVLPVKTDWQDKSANYSHFFKTYIPGVASPFKQVNDSGEGWELKRGAATGHQGQARIIWALLQAINNVHRYFLNAPLISASEAVEIVTKLDLSRSRLMAMGPDVLGSFSSRDKKTREVFESILIRLHKAVEQHWPDNITGRPKKIDPGIVASIYVSIFGFSRGATQARAFTQWLLALCQLDGQLRGRWNYPTLGGFKIEVDFVGLFDSVASVGAGNTFGNLPGAQRLNGHGAWAAADCLRIPEGVRCTHLVSAHEIRRSFPLDSIAVGQVLPAGCDEVVFPGVHSDLGCGYSPCEQGRGVDPSGADMLARLPLLYMYKTARLAGVPLKLELASETARQRFEVAPATIAAFNDYVAAASVKTGSLTAIMREQVRFHIQWRLARRIGSRAPMESSRSFARATAFDQNDLHSANREFEHEIAVFESWLANQGKGFKPLQHGPGYDNDREKEWEEIASWWHKILPPPQAVLAFFDEYIHDSRAWFKLIPFHADNEDDARIELNEKVAALKAERERNASLEKELLANRRASYVFSGRQPRAAAAKFQPPSSQFSDAEQKMLDDYARTHQFPRLLTSGREPFELGPLVGIAGYLRYRKIYGGSDNVLLTDATEAAPAATQIART